MADAIEQALPRLSDGEAGLHRRHAGGRATARMLFVAIARGVVDAPAEEPRTPSPSTSTRRLPVDTFHADQGALTMPRRLPRLPVPPSTPAARTATAGRGRPRPRPDLAGALHEPGRARQPPGLRLRPASRSSSSRQRGARRRDAGARQGLAAEVARGGDRGRGRRSRGRARTLEVTVAYRRRADGERRVDASSCTRRRREHARRRLRRRARRAARALPRPPRATQRDRLPRGRRRRPRASCTSLPQAAARRTRTGCPTELRSDRDRRAARASSASGDRGRPRVEPLMLDVRVDRVGDFSPYTLELEADELDPRFRARRVLVQCRAARRRRLRPPGRRAAARAPRAAARLPRQGLRELPAAAARPAPAAQPALRGAQPGRPRHRARRAARLRRRPALLLPGRRRERGVPRDGAARASRCAATRGSSTTACTTGATRGRSCTSAVARASSAASVLPARHEGGHEDPRAAARRRACRRRGARARTTSRPSRSSATRRCAGAAVFETRARRRTASRSTTSSASTPGATRSAACRRARPRPSCTRRAATRPPCGRCSQAGDHLVLEEVRGPATGLAADADPAHRQVVELEEVERRRRRPALAATLVGGELQLRGPADDPLPLRASAGAARTRCASRSASRGATPTSARCANVIGRARQRRPRRPRPDHGPRRRHAADRRRRTRASGCRSSARPADDRRDAARRRPHPAVRTLRARRGARRRRRSAWSAGARPARQPARRAALRRRGRRRRPRRCSASATASTARARSRRRPTLRGVYRVGNGRAGNVGAEALAHVALAGLLPRRWIVGLRNPLAGGRRASTPRRIEEVRRRAPQAFRAELLRAVTEADWARAARAAPRRPGRRRHAPLDGQLVHGLRRASTRVDRADLVDLPGRPHRASSPASSSASARASTRFRLAGLRHRAAAAAFVPLELEVEVCAAPGHFRTRRGRGRASTRSPHACCPTARRGFFHPDNFTFGQPRLPQPPLRRRRGASRASTSAVVSALPALRRRPLRASWSAASCRSRPGRSRGSTTTRASSSTAC